jgi:ABC-type transporter Mla maintaining outer membrane lipid asymmetry permease subunit MlaE
LAEASETPAEPSLIARTLTPLTDALDGIGRFLMLTAQSVTWVFRPPYRVTQLLAAAEFIGVQSMFIVALTGVFSGMVLALQMTYSLRQYGAEGVAGARDQPRLLGAHGHRSRRQRDGGRAGQHAGHRTDRRANDHGR